MNKPVLVVMAAGMGSRYGGLKQVDPVGSHGQLIIDYSIYDARRAGFETVVFVIKHEIEETFKAAIGDRLSKVIEVKYAYQELTDLPEGYSVPEGRVKPFGTAHAILAARKVVDGPFAVVNADDYYGKSAYKTIYDALCNLQDGEKADWCMVGYLLGNTVTDHGSVARGVCNVDENGYLTNIVERTKIEKYDGGIRFIEDDVVAGFLTEDTLVSMNLFGFTPSLLDALAEGFPEFLEKEVPQNPAKKEYLLPTIVNNLLHAGKARLKVLSSADKWYGVTYAADKPMVVAALKAMAAEGKYPDGLWG